MDLVGEGNVAEDFGDGGARFLGDLFSFAKGEDGGAGATDAEAEGSGRDGGALGLVEFGNEFLAAGLGDDVVDGAADEPVVGLDEAADETAEVADLGGGIGEGDFLGKDFAGHFGENFDVGMDHGGPEVFGDGEFGDVEFGIVAHEDDPSQQRGPDVVGMPGAVGGGFSGHREGKELLFGKRRTDEGVDGEGSCDGGSGGRAQSGTEGHPFVDFHLDAEIVFSKMIEKVESGDASGVFGGLGGEFSFVAGDGGDAEAGFLGVASDDVVTGSIDRKAEHVVAASDVGNGGGGEDGDFRR